MRRPITYSTTIVAVLWCLIGSVEAATDLHIGMIAPFSGRWAKRGEKALEIAEYALDWLTTQKSNTLNGVEWNFIVHHCDMETTKDGMTSKVVPFVQGTLDTRNAATWKYADHTLLKTGAAGVEPAPHRLDVLFMHWGSGFIPHGLQALKDAGETLPVYACGSNGEPAWKTNGVNRWDFANNCGELLSDDEMRPAINLLGQHEAKTIIFLEQLNAGAWTASLCEGARKEAIAEGIEIIADATIELEECSDEEAEPTKFKECRDKNIALFEKTYGEHLYKGKTYSADGLVLCAYADQTCPWLPEYLNDNNINFGLIIGKTCTAMGEEWVQKHFLKKNNKYNFDYWLHFVYQQGISGISYNQQYNPVGMFASYGEGSSNGMAKEIQTMRGLDINAPADPYRDGLFFNGWHMLLEDVYFSKGDKTKLGQFFGNHRSPSTSHWGLLSQTPGGWSKFHKATVVQKFPTFLNKGQLLVVSPLDVADAVVSYPAPFWSKRACEDKCVDCVVCDYLEGILQILTIVIVILCAILALLGAGIAKSIGGPKAPSVIFNSALMFGAFLLNIVTDIFAIMTMYAQMEEEIIDKNDVTTYIYAALIIVDILPAWARLKVHGIGIGLGWTNEENANEILYFQACDQVACLLGTPFDLGVFVLQCNVALIAPSYAVITSMLMTGMSLGYSAGCPGTLSVILKLLKGTDFNVGDHCSVRRLTIVTANPLNLKLMKPKEELEKYRAAEGKAQDDKSK